MGRRAKLETALLMEAGFGGGVGLAGRGMLDLGVWEEELEDGPSVWVCVEALGRTRRGTRGRWPGADSGLWRAERTLSMFIDVFIYPFMSGGRAAPTSCV